MGFVGHDCYGVYTIFLMIVYTLEITWMHVRLYIFRDNTHGAKSTIMGVECRGENQLKILPKAKEKESRV
jgi:hypothetical protein